MKTTRRNNVGEYLKKNAISIITLLILVGGLIYATWGERLMSMIQISENEANIARLTKNVEALSQLFHEHVVWGKSREGIISKSLENQEKRIDKLEKRIEQIEKEIRQKHHE